MVLRYRSPSLLMFFCRSRSPEFLPPGRNPRKQPTSRLFRNRWGSSMVSTYVSAICVPTPFTCLSKDTSGYTSLAIFSIRSSYSLMRSFSDSISLSNGSRTSRNSMLNAAASSRLLLRATLGQPLTIRLYQPARCVHQGRSSTHQFSSRPDYRQMDLRLHTAMPYRPQSLRIDSRQSCQCPCIVSIIFSIALGDQLHFLCVRHDHFVSQLSEQPAYPGGMCSCLQCDETSRYLSKGLLHRFRCGRQFLFQNDLACFIQNTVERPAISQIQADRQFLLLENFVLQYLYSASLFHSRSPVRRLNRRGVVNAKNHTNVK